MSAILKFTWVQLAECLKTRWREILGRIIMIAKDYTCLPAIERWERWVVKLVDST